MLQLNNRSAANTGLFVEEFRFQIYEVLGGVRMYVVNVNF